MNYSITWLVPDRVILVKLLRQIHIEDARTVINDLYQMLDTGQYPVHVLLDDSDGGTPPFNLPDLQKLFRFGKHPNLGWLIAYGTVPHIARLFTKIIGRTLGIRYIRLSSSDEAISFIKSKDPALPLDLLMQVSPPANTRTP